MNAVVSAAPKRRSNRRRGEVSSPDPSSDGRGERGKNTALCPSAEDDEIQDPRARASS